MNTASQPVADVCLVLEGTYPYVSGGVSTWIDQLLRGLPDLTFAIYYIGARVADTAKRHYRIPGNVVAFQEVHLYERLSAAQLKPGRPRRSETKACYDALRSFYLAGSDAGRVSSFWNLTGVLERMGSKFTFGNLCQDVEAWDLLLEICEQTSSEESFIDFFWTTRFVHLPVWWTWLSRLEVPRARVYHSVSTGFAGFLGALAARRHQAPYLITEHGIYTKERILEISQANWIHEPETQYFNFEQGLGQLKQMWIGLFTFLGLLSYEAAQAILTLYHGNRQSQIELGANPEKIQVVPNGIDPAVYEEPYRLRTQRRERADARPTVGFVGRVVPIKDLKTLLRAARLTANQMPEVEFLLVGPTDEDPQYFAECQEFANMLGLGEQVKFLGIRQVTEALPAMDVLVLTSLSEGMPLVILEAFATGIPVVATEVGACRDLIFGHSEPDKKLGRAGFITRTISPIETAQALVRILRDKAMNQQMGEAGRRRVTTLYRQCDLFAKYREIYTQYGGHRD